MVTNQPNIPQEPIHFRVVAIERFALPDPVKRDYTMLRVHYLNPNDALRGASFDLSPNIYVTYRDAIDEALRSGATYWVIWDMTGASSVPQQRSETVLDRLLRAIRDKQIVSDAADHG